MIHQLLYRDQSRTSPNWQIHSSLVHETVIEDEGIHSDTMYCSTFFYMLKAINLYEFIKYIQILRLGNAIFFCVCQFKSLLPDLFSMNTITPPIFNFDVTVLVPTYLLLSGRCLLA